MTSAELPPELDARPQSRREWSGYLRSLVLPLGFVVAIVGVLLYVQSSRGGSTTSTGFASVELPAEKNVTGKAATAMVSLHLPSLFKSFVNIVTSFSNLL